MQRKSLANRIAGQVFIWLVIHVIAKRPMADKILGAERPQGPYLMRWYLLPWRGWFEGIPEDQRTWWQRAIKTITKYTLPNLYLHKFVGDDDDRALHDHPSAAISFILAGRYFENRLCAGEESWRTFKQGDLRFMGPRYTHRIALFRDANGKPECCYTLFLFFPTVREWGFHCPQGWRHWKEFTSPDTNGTETGRGCD